jgi:hypothetical protein
MQQCIVYMTKQSGPSFFLFFSLTIKDKTKISLTIKILHLGQGSFTRKVRTILHIDKCLLKWIWFNTNRCYKWHCCLLLFLAWLITESVYNDAFRTFTFSMQQCIVCMTKKIRIILINFRFQIGNDRQSNYITNIKAKSKRYHWIQKIPVLKRLFIQNFCKRSRCLKENPVLLLSSKNKNNNEKNSSLAHFLWPYDKPNYTYW